MLALIGQRERREALDVGVHDFQSALKGMVGKRARGQLALTKVAEAGPIAPLTGGQADPQPPQVRSGGFLRGRRSRPALDREDDFTALDFQFYAA